MDRQTLINGRSGTDSGGSVCPPHLAIESFATSSDLMTAALRLADAWRSKLAADFAPLELNDARFAVLQAVDESGDAGCSQTDLARRLRNSESNVSTLLNRMVADNLVERRRCKTDRRKSVIRLTQQGAARLALARDEYRRAAEGLINDWPPSQRQLWMRQLTQLCDALDAEEVQPDTTWSTPPHHAESSMRSRVKPALSLHPGM